jgi:hypothetical protein
MPEGAHDTAMKYAIDLLHQAEDTDDFRERDSLRGLASTYISMARELRIGRQKSKYTTMNPTKPIKPVPLDPEKFSTDEDDPEYSPV